MYCTVTKSFAKEKERKDTQLPFLTIAAKHYG